MQLPSQLLK